MALDFPNAPTNGDTFQDWTWNGTAWVAGVGVGGGGGASVTVSDAPPGSPKAGDLWWDSVGGQLYVRFEDPDTSQWVIANSGGGGAYLPSTGGTLTGPLNATDLHLSGFGTVTGPLNATALNLSGSGINYEDLSGGDFHAIGFGWDGASFTGWIDGGNAGPLAYNSNFANYVPKGGGTMTGVLTMWGSTDMVSLVSPPGGVARIGCTVQDARFWTCGVVPNGDFAIADESAGLVRLTLTTAGTASFNCPLYGSSDAHFGGGVSANTLDAVDGMVYVRKGNQMNPAVTMHDGATIRSYFYFDTPTGKTAMYDVYSGGSLQVDPAANFNFNGSAAWKPGGGPWADASDARIKTVLGEYTLGLDEILRVQPIRYVYNGNDTVSEDVNAPESGVQPEGQEKDDATEAPWPNSPHRIVAQRKKPFVGFVAQEIEDIFPEMVSKRAGFIDGKRVADLRDVDTNSLIYALVNAVKTLAAKVEALEAAR